MSRLAIENQSGAQQAYFALSAAVSKRLTALSAQQCPVEYTTSLARVFAGESCGKCTPCRVGLQQISELLQLVVDGEANEHDMATIQQLARSLFDASDCALGFEAGRLLLECLDAFKQDFERHVLRGECVASHHAFPPCQNTCPAHVNIPAYIALVGAGKCEDALRVIRNDNPFPAVCGYVCEHPCELTCRRTLVDSAINICGIKRFAADNAAPYAVQENRASTGKSIGIIGGGPAGLTAAYYLQLMGHATTVYEARPKLGGMTRYGIPDYRLPQEKLDADISFILSTGVVAKCNTQVGTDVSVEALCEQHDALYVCIGAHNDKTLGIEGENSRGVISAVEFLRAAGNGAPINLENKRVAVVGGGNVAMDCARTAKRLGAQSVEVFYRRRIADMTALAEEIEEAQAEGVQISQLKSPVAITCDENECVTGITVQPQLISVVKGGRPSTKNASVPPVTAAVDVVLVAIGQAIDSAPFAGIASLNRDRIVAGDNAQVCAPVAGGAGAGGAGVAGGAGAGGAGAVAGAGGAGTHDGASNNIAARTNTLIFAGGDAVSGPATVIKAIAAGKVAAANIDQALGFAHNVHETVELPPATPALGAAGRVNLEDRPFAQAARDFDLAKIGMSAQAVQQECSRCLRCDSYGFNTTCGKEVHQW